MTGYVYFMQAVSGGPIKIGWSQMPERRLKQYMVWSPMPLRLLATVEAQPHAELMLHARFRDFRLHHEWFRPSPALVDLVEYVREHGKLDRPARDLSSAYDKRPYFRESLLRQLLDRHGLTPAALANYVGKPESLVIGWCKTYVPLTYAETILDFFEANGAAVRADDWIGDLAPSCSPFQRPVALSDAALEAAIGRVHMAYGDRTHAGFDVSIRCDLVRALNDALRAGPWARLSHIVERFGRTKQRTSGLLRELAHHGIARRERVGRPTYGFALELEALDKPSSEARVS